MTKESIFKATRKDFRIDTFKSGGKGGQHQNKTDSGVRITHIDTGLSAECREHRSQRQNKLAAFRKLAEKLVQHAREINKPVVVTSQERVRTYNHATNLVTDHATGTKMSYKEAMEQDGIGTMISLRRKVCNDRISTEESNEA